MRAWVRVRSLLPAYAPERTAYVVLEYVSGGAVEANTPERYDQVETRASIQLHVRMQRSMHLTLWLILRTCLLPCLTKS